MLKKVIGIISILLGVFLGLSTIAQGLLALVAYSTTASSNTAYSTGYLTGQAIASLLFLLLAFFLIKIGVQWLKAKKKSIL